MPVVAYAFDDFDMAVERNILKVIDAELVPTHGLQTPESLALLSNADALMVTLQKVTAEVVAAMPRARIISRLGVGLDSIDIPAATAAGIWVANVPDYGVDEVSTHAAALMLTQLRGIPRLVSDMRQGVWNLPAVQPIRRFSLQTVGVLGFGRIGRAFATKVAGFGVRVIAHDPFLSAEQISAGSAQPVDLETLFRESDFISLHLPLSADTKHIVDAHTLGLMKPGAYIVNTARGGLIDEAALLEAVQSGRLRGAALDVLSVEPPPKDHPVLSKLVADPRILLTPHAAWYSEEAMIDMRAKGADEVVRVLSGQKPRVPVNAPDPARS
jgi:D-3-phosphoglycerate dehydrogenase / 2-oxoglutarate reductase